MNAYALRGKELCMSVVRSEECQSVKGECVQGSFNLR